MRSTRLKEFNRIQDGIKQIHRKIENRTFCTCKNNPEDHAKKCLPVLNALVETRDVLLVMRDKFV